MLRQGSEGQSEEAPPPYISRETSEEGAVNVLENYGVSAGADHKDLPPFLFKEKRKESKGDRVR